MQLSRKPFWENSYRDSSQTTFGNESEEFRELVPRLKSNAKVLDLGCGEGRNALYLASSGFDVTAVDISFAGIENLCSNAEAKSLEIKTIVQEMRSFEFEINYDLIISHGCLHLIIREEWAELLDRMKANTNPGGYNVIAVFTNQIHPPPDLQEFCVGLLEEGELFEQYQNWDIIQKKAYIMEDEHPGNIHHRHSINKLVAQLPISVIDH